MTLTAVNVTESDGSLGILPPSAGKLQAFVGPSSSGPVNTPATYGRIKDIVATFGQGPLVEAAAIEIDRYGKPVVVVRSGNTVAGTVGSIVSDADGTSVVTVHASPTPNDDLDIVVKFVVGGTRGVAGATYQISVDGGRNFGGIIALGTGTSIDIIGAGGVTFDLAAGTFVAGDTHSARTVAPNFNSSELQSALDALAASAASWECVELCGPVDATTFDNIETKCAGMFAAGKYHWWIGSPRVPNVGESEATYLGAMNTAFGAKSTRFGALCFGAVKISSAVSGRKYRRSTVHAVGPFAASVSEEVNIGDLTLGSIPGVSIRDVNGNPDEHDETLNPGADDARFLALRTWDGYPGVYVNRPRLFSTDGSDFQLIPHRRVLNLAHAAVRAYFIRRINRPILVRKDNGLILESEALEIEAGAMSALRDTLLAKPKASAVQFALSRVDNLLSTKTLNATARVVPLAYPEFINIDVGYVNPALLVQAV
jgi:hypothetical protein